MKITRIVPAEGCVPSVKAYDIFCEPALSEDQASRLAGNDRLELHEGFARPYFKISRSRTWVLQGVIGSHRLRATLLPEAGPAGLETLRHLVEEEG
jgi:hypothetical protein